MAMKRTPSLSSLTLSSTRATITLFLLCIGTLSDVFIVRADWPIVRYKNSTVGVKNDGGIVQVQSTDLLVDGNLNVSGKMFVQNRDVAEYEDRVSFLETTLGVNSTSNANCTESYRTRKYPKTATNWDYLSLPSEFYSWSVDFPKSTGTDPILSWDQINRLCLNKGMKLCKSVDLCPNNEPAPGLNIWGTELSTSNDHWIAVGDESNEWYSFNNPKCTKHSIHSGSKPTWGTGTVNYNVMSRAGLCCSELASQPTSLTHWIDFSTHYMESLYGLTSTLNVLTFADNMGNATNIKVNGNVKYTTNVQNGLGAVYMNAEQTGLEFTSSKLGSNPEVVVVYRIVSKTVSGLLLSSRLNGYHFGTYKTKDGYVGCSATNGRLIVEQEASYDEWHVANLYFGNNDAFLIVDGDESKKNTFGIAGRYGTSSLTNVLIGFYPSTDHYVNAYVGEVMYFNSKLSNSDRSMVTSYLMSKWGISSSENTTCTESSIGESVSVISELQSLKPPKCMRPGGTGLFFDGTSWICECVENATHVYHGTSCENTCTQNSTHFWNTTALSCAQNPYESNMIFNFEALKEHVEGGKWSNAISSESYGDGSISEGIARSTISTSLESDPPSIVFSGGATNADWKDAVLLPELDLKRDWSFEIKVKMHDVTRNQGFFGHGTHGTRTGIFLTVMKSPWNRGIVFSFGNSDLDDKTTPLVANDWYHIIFTYAHSNGYLKAIYVNGELTVSSGGSSELPYLGTGQPLIGRTLGLDATSSARYGLDGEIAFARMYDKTLSASEVKTLHDLS